MKSKILTSLAAAATLAFVSCQTPGAGMNRAEQQALGGAALGAIGGAVIGNNVDGVTAEQGAMLGAGAGALGGYAHGRATGSGSNY